MRLSRRPTGSIRSPSRKRDAAAQAIALNEISEVEHLYQTAPIGLVLFDANLRYIRLNERLAGMNGLPIDAHLGRTVREVVPDLADQAEKLRDAFIKGAGPIVETFTGTTPAEPGVLRHWRENWSPIRTAEGRLIAINVAVEEITELKRQEERNALLSREIGHRLANVLSVVQAIARSSFRGLEGAQEQVEVFEKRLAAVATAQAQLAKAQFQSAEAVTLVRQALRALPEDQISTIGPVAYVGPAEALALSLVLHELGTNALKYGALSIASGKVLVTWRTGEGHLILQWQERDGPVVSKPSRSGFGHKLIKHILTDGSCVMDFEPAGLTCSIQVRLDKPQI